MAVKYHVSRFTIFHNLSQSSTIFHNLSQSFTIFHNLSHRNSIFREWTECHGSVLHESPSAARNMVFEGSCHPQDPRSDPFRPPLGQQVFHATNDIARPWPSGAWVDAFGDDNRRPKFTENRWSAVTFCRGLSPLFSFAGQFCKAEFDRRGPRKAQLSVLMFCSEKPTGGDCSSTSCRSCPHHHWCLCTSEGPDGSIHHCIIYIYIYIYLLWNLCMFWSFCRYCPVQFDWGWYRFNWASQKGWNRLDWDLQLLRISRLLQDRLSIQMLVWDSEDTMEGCGSAAVKVQHFRQLLRVVCEVQLDVWKRNLDYLPKFVNIFERMVKLPGGLVKYALAAGWNVRPRILWSRFEWYLDQSCWGPKWRTWNPGFWQTWEFRIINIQEPACGHFKVQFHHGGHLSGMLNDCSMPVKTSELAELFQLEAEAPHIVRVMLTVFHAQQIVKASESGGLKLVMKSWCAIAFFAFVYFILIHPAFLEGLEHGKCWWDRLDVPGWSSWDTRSARCTQLSLQMGSN